MTDLKKNRVIAVGSDHAGFARKQVILKYFEEKGILYKDFGCYTDESCDYADFAHLVADALERGEFETGITFCGSGQGVNMTANKHQHIRSALCWTPEISALARRHNNANICAIPGRFVTDNEAIDIVDAFLNAEFEGGRHARRIAKIPLK